MHLRRGWSLLLLPGGLAVGHVLGYWAARLQGYVAPETGGDHGYVHMLLLASVPLSLILLARVLLGVARDEPLPLTVPSLAAQFVTGFMAVELFEYWLAGFGPGETLLMPTTFWGVCAQVLVATLAVLFLHGLGTVARRLRRRHARERRSTRMRPPVVSAVATAVVPVWSLSRRGPPLPCW